MPHITAQVSPLGPLLDVRVGVSLPRQEALQKANAAVPVAVPARLLIDTGTSGTVLDPAIISQLGTTSTGIMTAHTPSTQQGAPGEFNQFDVSLHIPTLTLTRSFQALPVGESGFKHQGFDCLLGRDVLAQCLLIYTGPDNAYLLSI